MKLIRTPLPMKLYLQKSPKRSAKTINKKQLIDYNYHDIKHNNLCSDLLNIAIKELYI